mgnify:CR=1 FL=1
MRYAAENFDERMGNVGAGALLVLVALAIPVAGLKTAMPSIAVLPDDASARLGYTEVQRAFGPGAPGTLQIVVPSEHADAAAATLREDSGITGAMPAVAAGDGSELSMIQAVPATTRRAAAVITSRPPNRASSAPGSEPSAPAAPTASASALPCEPAMGA